MKNSVTDESSVSKVSADVNNRIETGKFSLSDCKMIKTSVVLAFVGNLG